MNKVDHLDLPHYSPRTFGWVQDPSNFRSLCSVVAVFAPDSYMHVKLLDELLPALVSIDDGRERLAEALKAAPLKLKYADLVGTAFTPRSSARCNGLIQAVVPGQRRPFISDWPADNFVRWAHALGFIRYEYESDTFEITQSGMDLVSAYDGSAELNANEKDLLVAGVLTYPPAIRVLRLLSANNGQPLTKFQIGRNLGFVGEAGFTSLDVDILARALPLVTDKSERRKFIADREGSADKYARMIGAWLNELGLVEKRNVPHSTIVQGKQHIWQINQSFAITDKGVKALTKASGRSRYPRIAKNVCYEMLATKGFDREYIRTRRAIVLKCIARGKRKYSFDEIKQCLSINGLDVSIDAIKDDLAGLINIGIDIDINDNYCIYSDKLNDFFVPNIQIKLDAPHITETKENLRSKLHFLSHDFLSLIDLAFNSKLYTLFEMKVLELLTRECGFEGMHMGGSRRPDGIVYTIDSTKNYGVIIDTKAYAKGYSLPISHADEMERYIRENLARDKKLNQNCWWENFDNSIEHFYFLFVSSLFTGNFEYQLNRISHASGIMGACIGISNLLLIADSIKGNLVSLDEVRELVFKNHEFKYDDHNIDHII